ncbi:hypothetical protein AB0M46_20710 [Dactylosporangium sp. NPDC051485]|uniref:hypothetical protein n=1 Tax=Dactylosporangium sp. NPDC051485 TaxID=3154846 RepID=UPI00342FEFFF
MRYDIQGSSELFPNGAVATSQPVAVVAGRRWPRSTRGWTCRSSRGWRGHRVRVAESPEVFGAGRAIRRTAASYVAGSRPRVDAMAAGY